MCKGLTKKGDACKNSGKYNGFCHIHRIQVSTSHCQALKEDITHKNNALCRKNIKISELKEIVHELKDELQNVNAHYETALFNMEEELKKSNEVLTILEEQARKYSTIVEFELFKSKIKSIIKREFYPNFHIKDIRHEKKYHDELKSTFNMEIDEIINEFYRKREIRNKNAHPAT